MVIYHEQREFVPYTVIEALKKYVLLDRFTATVKSFANRFDPASGGPGHARTRPRVDSRAMPRIGPGSRTIWY